MFDLNTRKVSELRANINQNYRISEVQSVNNLLKNLAWKNNDNIKITQLARDLINKVRSNRIRGRGMDAIMQEFKLSTTEGVALMCLAESLLRIPDKFTQNKLIKDKLNNGNWKSHTQGNNFFVNATSWGLLISGKLIDTKKNDDFSTSLTRLIAKWGEPIIRKAMTVAVRLMGNQFVMGETITKALSNAKPFEERGYQFSYDMLGEAALTDEDAQKYLNSYIDAIHKVGVANTAENIYNKPGISVKLSAIHPRYTRSKYALVINELYPRLKQLYLLAKQYQIGLFIDAEETERLDISLDLLEKLLSDPELTGFTGIGFVVQAYQKRGLFVIDYITDLATKFNARIMLRLVKGAYWDSEIKKAQVDGLSDYPVFTRKFHTDLSFIACAQKMLDNPQSIYSLFATHNAHTLATIYTIANGRQFEFQCLYGMGETLYDNVVGVSNLNVTCRIYAPVGTYETLLAYLVRRLLENGANSSFVHQLVDPSIPIDELLISPVELSIKSEGKSNPQLKMPAEIYPDARINSRGYDLSDELFLKILEDQLNDFSSKKYCAKPLIENYLVDESENKLIINPANKSDVIGNVIFAKEQAIDMAITNALGGFATWSVTSPQERADKILKFANLIEVNYYELINILIREAGKTLSSANAEIREAVDFCRFYSLQVIKEFDNVTHKALGVIVCISPWNFPLAIFVGEVVSSLVAGNTVIAKPSAQTNLVAYIAVKLMHKAGIPTNVIQLMPGSGSVIGNKLTQDPRINGVIFTGSTEVAQIINQNISNTANPGILIAETGGQNTMIVDSTALPEQVVADVINSGFDSAGQRCSALRVLYLQDEIADKIIHMLKGAMDQLQIGDPTSLSTDIGPVIDERAKLGLLKHIEQMRNQALMIYQAKISHECDKGFFVAPTIFEIGSISQLDHEVFGPIIHIIRYHANELDKVIDQINSSGYGLTQGLHSRLEETAKLIYTNVNAGNIYINRNMVGAVVGAQPFGGEGLSGTGPKAGGSFYLYRLVKTFKSPQLVYSTLAVKWDELDNFINKLPSLGLEQNQIIDLTDLANNLKHLSPICHRLELPGPTGEHNFMLFKPRGKILCVASNLYDYTKQIIYTLLTGNQILLINDEINVPLNSILPVIKYIDKIAEQDFIHAVLVSNNFANLAQLRQDFAQRESLLTHIICENENGYNMELLITERTVSINVTATGGNVELMSIHDKF